ncbi:TetR/AcrR family transcriptional regulator [Nocardioides sp.]|uniref:TetR/AcrR family transcriptional regulator n=1 Tax=Nocardioides sp. TaxID=35761 RepID=UPI0027373717|nr:TetR/AcrR family transcriptional regulator [Nocardioides sp.]MDP3894453.1 WHG domain-containing protein [Nocardioides sp.]
MTPAATGRRERQREATYDEIVSTSRALLNESGELSLRALAARMGMTAPALYRYVANYQELVDLVAFEIDKAATVEFRASAERHPDDDPAARLVAASVAFRRWALTHPREFTLVFANPIADSSCVRRELLTAATSGHYMNGLLLEIHERYDFPIPALEDLDPTLREVVVEPLIPIDVSLVPMEERGMLWLFMRAWASLYGVVTLEVFGHMDPRVIEGAAMFRDMITQWIPRLGMADEAERLVALLDAELARD